MIHSLVSLDLASVATLIMCERDVSAAYPSGTSPTESSPVAALFACLLATSLPAAPLCAGAHRMATFLARIREQISMAATANRWPGPRASSLTRLMAEVESTKTVYWPSPSCSWSRVLRA